jgi:hypothetical protein
MTNNEHHEGPGNAVIPAAGVIIGSVLTFVLLYSLHVKYWNDPMHPTAGASTEAPASNH